ncbi:MAG TPA: amidohydrolase family protein [Ilumatobacteraceae bacterium]|nr:amidohydrolase family protein [Ilumatobacteraceae bacterium]
MTMPQGIDVFDTMIGLPPKDRRGWQKEMSATIRDADSKTHDHPAGYMFQDVPKVARTDDPAAPILDEMAAYNVSRGLIAVSYDDPDTVTAIKEHAGRLYGAYLVDPNLAMDGVRNLERAVTEDGCVAACYMPAGLSTPVAINDKKVYPLYAKCVELGIPIFVNGGVPGPRVPMDTQYVGLVDEVCWFFPELKFIFRHGCEPWVDLAVKLMLKWPNLYYSTSAFAPKYYPQAIVDFANTRGADKIIYAGYYPYGLELSRIFAEMPNVGFRDEVWPKFLRDNALRVLNINQNL